jgi:transketolase
MTTEETPFEIGKASILFKTDVSQATIFGTGYLLQNALLAAEELEKEGIKVEVVNVSTIKPLDEAAVLASLKQTGAAVTVEDHQVDGGLGGAIAEFAAKNIPVPIEFIGLKNTFAESGKPAELIEKYKMGKNDIKEAVKNVISRKK